MQVSKTDNMGSDDDAYAFAFGATLLAAFLIIPTLCFAVSWRSTNEELSVWQCPNLNMSILDDSLLTEMSNDYPLLIEFMKSNHINMFTFWTDANRLVKYRLKKTSEICLPLPLLSAYGYSLTEVSSKNNTYIGTLSYVKDHTLFKATKMRKVAIAVGAAALAVAANSHERVERTFICFEDNFPLNHKLLIAVFCRVLKHKHDFLVKMLIVVLFVSVLMTLGSTLVIWDLRGILMIFCCYPTVMLIFDVIAYNIYPTEDEITGVSLYQDYAYATLF